MRKLFLSVTLLLASTSIYAIPAQRGVYKHITLKDGTSVLAELFGDELMSYWKTEDGQCYVLDPEDGTYTEARLEMLAEQVAPIRLANARRRAAQRKVGSIRNEYKGRKKGLIILANFYNKTFKATHDQAFYERVANEVGFTSTLGFKGSVKDYFLTQSNGDFELDFDVVGPVDLPKDYEYYGAHGSTGNDSHPGLMVATAMQKVEAKYDLDFSQYDWDGNGYIDQVFVLFAGGNEASGGGEDTIWPHEWTLDASDYGKSYITKSELAVNTYACGSELAYSYVLNRITGEYIKRERTDGIGTICHEFSHCLGLPDMYDTHGNQFGMGSWDLMSSGNYNGNSYSPAGYTVYEKMLCGWQEPIVLDQPTTVRDIRPSSEGGASFIVYNDKYPDEYYLLENRQLTGWDAGLPGKGLLITHVDYDPELWRYNLVNANYTYSDGTVLNDHQRCTIFHADDTDTKADEAGDTYPYTSEDGFVNDALTNSSLPAAILYNADPYMGKPITDITQNADGTVSFNFMGGSDSHVVSGIDHAGTVLPPAAVRRIYSIDGRYLGTSLPPQGKGIYIVDGQKVIR